MTLLRATQFASLLSLAIVLMFALTVAQNIPDVSLAAASVVALPRSVDPQKPARAYPRLRLWGNQELTYLGMFSADAVFRTPSRMAGATGYSQGEGIPPAPTGHQATRQGGAPESMLLSNERAVENFISPAHATAIAQAASPLGETRNRFVTYACGRPSVLTAPTHVATDSQRRLVISDPDGNAVHVLDPKGKTSFRIVSGSGHRLQHPAGVAVDADDNIYVVDSARGMVLVFDRFGTFVRYIGDYKGEPQYASPDGIAIDQRAGRIYIVDSPRNLIFMLDLSGKPLKSLGKSRDGIAR